MPAGTCPPANRNGRAEYLASHLPGAVFFGIDDIADKSTGLPHMLPTPEAFAAAVGQLGIADTDTIVVYDEAGVFAAPARLVDPSAPWAPETCACWMAAARNGAPRAGRPLRAEEHPAPRTFVPHYQAGLVQDFDAVLGLTRSKAKTIVDARPRRPFSR